MDTVSYFPYCQKCLEQPTKDTKEFYDYRFEYPVCIKCVSDYNLDDDLDEQE